MSRIVHGLPWHRGALGRSLAGRRQAAARWAAWARTARRGAGGPLVWSHAASVGEALAVEPIIRRLRRALPDSLQVLTYSSASAADWPEFPYVDHADFVPLDERAQVAQAMDALRPSLLLFSRGDLWPELVGAASCRGVPVAITGGTVRPGSARLRWPARALFRRMYESVCYAGAVSEGDAQRLATLGVPGESMHVTGDPRHAQILERAPRPGIVAPVHAWAPADRCLIVAGSVEPSDMEAVSRGVARAVGERGRAIIVPHSPSADTLRVWGAHLERLGLRAGVWNGHGSSGADEPVLLVGATGLLQDLYLVADMAYVGGGFRRGGLHAVAEPAAVGVPVIVGPKWRADRDAAELLRVGGAVALGETDPGSALFEIWRRWSTDPTARRAAGLHARRCINGDAADRDGDALARVLRPSPRMADMGRDR